MKTLVLYALEVLACSGVLLAAYSILLERRVAFRWCRACLLTATLLAAVIPLLRIPVWPGGVIEAAPPVVAEVPAEAWAPETAALVDAATPAVTPEAVCCALYLLGAGLILGTMVAQAMRIRRLRRGAEISRTDRFTLVRTRQPIASFSFFRTIYVWRETPAEELPAIVAHEASHIAHRHSLERIAMECMKAAMWWNPFAWIAARRLTEAEEFEADSDVLAGGYDVEHYMNVLFKQLFGHSPEIANGLRNSLTKKRFQMMTSSKPGRYPLLRLAGTFPVVIGLLCAFSFTTRASEIRIPDTPANPPQAQADTLQTPEAWDGGGHYETMPSFRNGDLLSFRKWVQAQVRYPEKLRQEGIQGRVVTSFVINEDGSLSDIGILQSPDEAFSKEAVRILGSSPKWTPGTKSGVPTRVKYTLPVDFRLDEEGNVLTDVPTRKPALFRGGPFRDFREWVQARVEYPAEAREQNIQGRVILSFIIRKDGSLTDINVVQSSDPRFSAEAVRIVESAPADAWTPASDFGTAVDRRYLLPVDFRLNDGSDRIDFAVVERIPLFRGREIDDFRQWAEAQLKYPDEVKHKREKAQVLVSFVIDTDGSVTDVRALRSPDEAFSEEAVRVISSSPKWQPGIREGKPMAMEYTLSVSFDPEREQPGSDETEPFTIVEKMPSFRSGDINNFRKWVQMNVKYPAEAMQKGIQGRIVLSFVVEPNGSLGDIQVLQSPGKLLTDEARRVIASSPAGAWSPGIQRGKPVRVKLTIPVDFLLQDGSGKLPEPAEKPAGSLDGVVVVGYAIRK